MKIKKFLNETFGEVRILVEGEDIWFLGSDVAAILGYQREQKAIQDHTSSDDRMLVSYGTENMEDLWSGNDRQKKTFINESGLYCMIFGSKMPAAEAFKRWVAKEVLPSIRKTGGYIAGQEDLAAEDREILEEKIRRLEQEVKKASDRNRRLGDDLMWTEDRLFRMQEAAENMATVPDEVLEYFRNPLKSRVIVTISSRPVTVPEKKYTVTKDGRVVQYHGYHVD